MGDGSPLCCVVGVSHTDLSKAPGVRVGVQGLGGGLREWVNTPTLIVHSIKA